MEIISRALQRQRPVGDGPDREQSHVSVCLFRIWQKYVKPSYTAISLPDELCTKLTARKKVTLKKDSYFQTHFLFTGSVEVETI